MINFKLRKVQDQDHDWLVELHNDPIVLKNLTNPLPITLDQHLGWWNGIKNSKSQERLIFEVNDARVGFTKFYNIDSINKNCVLGADIHKDHRGLGYAKTMWSLMLNHCFDDLNLFRASLTTAEYNQIGQKVYKNLGFIEEGRMIKSLLREDVFYDQICMYITREMWIK